MDVLLETPLGVDELRHDLQLVKCVVVGDTGVGKTRLICARTCERRYSLHELMQTHVPTVWAIDQYRKNSQVLNSSWRVIDGVNVSLRLWDTFGDHDKDRRFAYGRADVVLVCFSVVQPRSLQSVRKHWFAEIQRFCAGVPVIVCGCQVDLRYLYADPGFIAIDKGPFFREITASDVLLPEVGRSTATKIGAYYYETSVLEGFGIEELFINVLRAALIGKRNRHFWMAIGSLKNVGRPVVQAPHQVPRPKAPVPEPPSLDEDMDFSALLDTSSFIDVYFEVQGVLIGTHSACLAISSPILFDLLGIVLLGKDSTPSMRCCAPYACTESTDITCLDHIIFQSVKQHNCSSGDEFVAPVVTVNNFVSPATFRAMLYFLYTGRLPSLPQNICLELHHLADQIGIFSLASAVANLSGSEDFLNIEIYKTYREERCQSAKQHLVHEGLFSDVLFEVDDGKVRGHRAVLVCQSEVMAGMFTNDFREKSAKLVSFPGVHCNTFQSLLEYLYTGKTTIQCLDDINSALQCMELIEVANRLCQPVLVSIVEHEIITALNTACENGHDIVEIVLSLLEPAQWHNAVDLAKWCLWYLCVNYSSIYRQYSKILHQLQPANQIHLTNHQWPPVWYQKECDLYEKKLFEQQRECHKRPLLSCLPQVGRSSHLLSCCTNRRRHRAGSNIS